MHRSVAHLSRPSQCGAGEVRTWHSDRSPPCIRSYFDALFVNRARRGGPTRQCMALGSYGRREELLYFVLVRARVKFWLSVSPSSQCGVTDCFIACVDGLKGLPEAIERFFPRPRCSCVSSTKCVTACDTCPGKSGASWPQTSAPSTARRPWQKPSRHWTTLRRAGMPSTPPSVRAGSWTGTA